MPVSSLSVLRQFVPPRELLERCDSCGTELAADHEHTFEPASRRIRCACSRCLSFMPATLQRIPRDVRILSGFHISDFQWDILQIPISLAFFSYSTPAEKWIALYPGPAGAAESLLRIDFWQDIASHYPELSRYQARRGSVTGESSWQRSRLLYRADRRVLQARGIDPDPLARLIGWCIRLGRDRPILQQAPAERSCMLSLKFTITKASAVPFAAAPTIAFTLEISRVSDEPMIKSIALRSQILIDATRRHYEAAEREQLRDLWGEPNRWHQTLRSLLWTHAAVTVPAFEKSVSVDLLVPCTFDFNVAATKYFHAVRNGDVPLLFQFSGTVFYAAANGAAQIEQIGWDQESHFRLPAAVWHEMMQLYYPNSVWLRLRQDAFDQLNQYKTQHGIGTWEEAIESLLAYEKETIS